MTAQLTPDKTFPTKTVVPGSWFTDLQTDRKTIARCFYDEATPDLPLAEQKKGTTWGDPTVGVLRYFRIDGAGDPRVSSPLRSMWIPSDQSPAGPPPLDGRVKDGDAYLADDGTDSYVAYYSATLARFWARGILAEYRTAATSLVPAQPSQSVRLRSSEWVAGSPGSAKWRQVRARYVQGALQLLYETEEGASHLAFTFNYGSSSSMELWGNPTGNVVPGFKYSRDRTGSNPGQISCTFSTEQTDTDGTQIWFHHGDNTRFARHRFRGSDAGALGAGAEVLSASYRLPATDVTPLRNSAASGWVASYWNSEVGVEAIAYAQHILTGTDPAGYLRHGFGYGPGTLDLYSSGKIHLLGTVALGGDWGEADGAGQIYQQATYTGLHTLDRHSCRILPNPIFPDGGSLTDMCRDSYPEGAGSSKGLDGPAGGAQCWEKISEDGTVRYVPVFATKDLGIPTPIYGELSLTDGSAASSITDGPDAWNPITGFDTEGLAAGTAPDTDVGAITPNVGALFECALSVSFSGDAASEYVFAVAEIVPGEGPPTFVQVGRQARVETIDTEKHAVAVTCLLNVTTGSALVPVVKSPTGATVGITVYEASFAIVQVASA